VVRSFTAGLNINF